MNKQTYQSTNQAITQQTDQPDNQPTVQSTIIVAHKRIIVWGSNRLIWKRFDQSLKLYKNRQFTINNLSSAINNLYGAQTNNYLSYKQIVLQTF